MSSELYEKKNFYDKLYKWALIFLLTFMTSLVIIGVRQIFVVTKRIDQSTVETQKSLDCIAKFFTITDRTRLTVTDLDKCTLSRK